MTGGLGDSRRPLGRGRRLDPEDFGMGTVAQLSS
jgi:hypothetical protein